MKSVTITEAECVFTLPTESPVKRKHRMQGKNANAMSAKTKDFIQRICYKQTATIDMTHYGFINDSKMNPINLILKPLRAQLEKICVLSNQKTECNSRQVSFQNETKPTVNKKKVTLIVPSKKVKKKNAMI
ncbi:hypothetical protein HW555_005100 [Spodoptera exigua]|uniref:Uncharacterized protein n=1 Tax=Spodoptera exigua TaxID=7107 RepID=A0A835GKE9_SPOEX|nr:hypothetical protein HW555_005100 [Spodoptera exigua]